MENGRNNDDGISGRQLRELLRSLPAAHAPEDLELNLLYRINDNELYPHRSRLRRFPRARTRAVANQSARTTRGIDRMRGLAAAALAAFIVAGSWTLFSEGAPLQSDGRSAASPLQTASPAAEPALDQSPMVESPSPAEVDPAPLTLNPASPTGRSGNTLQPIELEWSEQVADAPTAAASNATRRTEPARHLETSKSVKASRTAPASSTTEISAPQISKPENNRTQSSSKTSVQKGPKSTKATIPAADSIAHTPAPIDTHEIGTGGEPPEEYLDQE